MNGFSAQARMVSRLASAFVIALVVACLVIVAVLIEDMTHQADALALRHETALVNAAFEQELALMARSQLHLAVSDEIVRRVHERRLDPDYAANAARRMWDDFDHSWGVIIGPETRTRLVARKGQVLPLGRGAAVTSHCEDLIEQARQGYYETRRPSAAGHQVQLINEGRLARIYAVDTREIEGELALVSAMAIVPRTSAVHHPNGPPAILVSVRSVEPRLVNEIGSTHLLDDLTYQADETLDPGSAHIPVAADEGRNMGYLVWRSARPGEQIRALVLPLAGGMALVYVGLAVVGGRRVTRLARALEASEARNREMATIDTLTGLPSRHQFGQDLEYALARCQTQPIAVLLIDLDEFKAVNDRFGHAAGDVVLQTAARRLHQSAGDGAVVARVGGDEFVALFPCTPRGDEVTNRCVHMITRIKAPIMVGGGEARIGASIGFAIAPLHASEPSAIMRLADEALVRAKEDGRGRVVGCSEEQARTLAQRWH